MRIWAESRDGEVGSMDEKDKEIEYLEDRIKELESLVNKLSKRKRHSMLFRHHPGKYSFGDMPDERKVNPVCSLCATMKNVKFKEEFDVFLCSNCENKWN